MSTYDLAPRPGDPPRQVRVGWDGDRATFFAQVLDPPAGGRRAEVLRLGASPYEAPTAYQVLQAVRPFVYVPPGLELRLERDAGPAEQRTATLLSRNDSPDLAAGGLVYLEVVDEDGPVRGGPGAAFPPLRPGAAPGGPAAPQTPTPPPARPIPGWRRR